MSFCAGDLVSCRDQNYFQQLSVKKNAGIVLESKKSTYKVMFDNFEGGFWLNEEVLKTADEEVSALVEEVSQLVKKFKAEAFDFELKKKSIYLELFLPQISLNELETIKQQFGSRLKQLDCMPHLMAVIKLAIEIEVTS